MQIGTEDENSKSLDEYFQLDYEDIIGGDLPTRFKYRSVKPNDYGIPASVILSKSSKELNQMVSIKKLRPYRDEEEPSMPSQSSKRHGKDQGDGDRGSKHSKGTSKGGGSKGSSKGRSKGPKVGKGRPKDSKSADEQLSSSRFKAYNLEGDKFAGVSKSKKGKKDQGKKAKT